MILICNHYYTVEKLLKYEIIIVTIMLMMITWEPQAI